ncbi:MAG TPA: LCP family protein [Streptosporangiaceae bacterium]|nr:LCP family protein [Streptosporangiaceae bacterium]
MASRVAASCMAVVVVGGSLYAYSKYRSIYDAITHVNPSADLNGTKRPFEDPSALNLLVIGSDTRSGKNGQIGGHVGISGQRSDTVMVVHVAPGASRGVVLSFPRDSVVPVLSCKREGPAAGQTAVPGQVEQINGTFANGGPGCLWKTIEQTAHIRINDFVELTFNGFEKVVNNLGGVEICLPHAVDVPQSGLHLSRGKHHVWGREALAWWRSRESIGEGSDLQRIQRDQFLMASLVQGIEHKGLLTSLSKMESVVSIAAHNMSTDMNLTRMLRVAEIVRHVKAKKVQFIEIPTVTYTPNPNWVQWSTQAPQLFSSIAHDTKLPKSQKKSTGTKAKLVVATPSSVNVEILNGSGLQGQGAEAASDLTGRGFNVLGNTNASNFNYTKSVIEYSSKTMLPAVRALKNDLDNVETLQTPGIKAGTVDLILGSTFTSLKMATTKKTSTATLTKTFGGITGGTNVCADKSAFAGPDG